MKHYTIQYLSTKKIYHLIYDGALIAMHNERETLVKYMQQLIEQGNPLPVTNIIPLLNPLPA